MVFKMLILLGFFIDQGGLFIHSDIHRGAANRVDYAVQIAPNRRLGLQQDATEICVERDRSVLRRRTEDMTRFTKSSTKP